MGDSHGTRLTPFWRLGKSVFPQADRERLGAPTGTTHRTEDTANEGAKLLVAVTKLASDPANKSPELTWELSLTPTKD